MAALTTKEHLAKHDREIAAIRKLLLSGMKMLNQVVEKQREIAEEQRQLQKSQRETDRQLQLFLRSLRGGNGHQKRST